MITDLIEGIVSVIVVLLGLVFALLVVTSPFWFIFGMIYLLK